jgi:hypothetical protein
MSLACAKRGMLSSQHGLPCVVEYFPEDDSGDFTDLLRLSIEFESHREHFLTYILVFFTQSSSMVEVNSQSPIKSFASRFTISVKLFVHVE